MFYICAFLFKTNNIIHKIYLNKIMIDKIHFSVNIFLYSINMLICILYFKIFGIDLIEYKLSEEFIYQKGILDQISLSYSIFLLIFCLIYIVIYKEIYGKDLLKDLFINSFYILLSTNLLYLNYRYFAIINTEINDFSVMFFGLPLYPLEKIKFILFIIQGLIALLIVFTLIKEIISYYRGLKNFILFYFENGGRIFFFEFRHLIC